MNTQRLLIAAGGLGLGLVVALSVAFANWVGRALVPTGTLLDGCVRVAVFGAVTIGVAELWGRNFGHLTRTYVPVFWGALFVSGFILAPALWRWRAARRVARARRSGLISGEDL